MSRYTVVWDPDVETRFIDAWVACDSDTRRCLSNVANWLDGHLANDPQNRGRAIPDSSDRVVAVPITVTTAHVAATFEVLPDDLMVRILRLTFKRRDSST